MVLVETRKEQEQEPEKKITVYTEKNTAKSEIADVEKEGSDKYFFKKTEVDKKNIKFSVPDGKDSKEISEAIEKLLIVESMLETAKKVYKDLNEAVQELHDKVGEGFMFQSPDGIVFKLKECTGQYIEYKKYSYDRTRRPSEDRGTLSITEARKSGFLVEGK